MKVVDSGILVLWRVEKAARGADGPGTPGGAHCLCGFDAVLMRKAFPGRPNDRTPGNSGDWRQTGGPRGRHDHGRSRRPRGHSRPGHAGLLA